jgi:hypothetical protein
MRIDGAVDGFVEVREGMAGKIRESEGEKERVMRRWVAVAGCSVWYAWNAREMAARMVSKTLRLVGN